MADVAREEMTVFQPAPLADFILWAIKHHRPPSTLAICTSRESFLEQLYSSTQSSRPPGALLEDSDLAADADTPLEQPDATQDAGEQAPLETHPLLSRTLQMLLSSQSIQLAFCPSHAALHAYLAAYSQAAIQKDRPGSASSEICDAKEGTLLLGLVNAVALHREAAAYSAQTLSKVFAASVEAASRAGAKLVVIECTDAGGGESTEREINEDAEMIENEADERAINSNEAMLQPNASETSKPNPWEDQVPILNPSTRAFGVSGERQWMDKKIPVKDIVARWCRFRRLDET